jgi:hypothetical protein
MTRGVLCALGLVSVAVAGSASGAISKPAVGAKAGAPAAGPPTGTATGAVTVNFRRFTTGTIPYGATVDVPTAPSSSERAAAG